MPRPTHSSTVADHSSGDAQEATGESGLAEDRLRRQSVSRAIVELHPSIARHIAIDAHRLVKQLDVSPRIFEIAFEREFVRRLGLEFLPRIQAIARQPSFPASMAASIRETIRKRATPPTTFDGADIHPEWLDPCTWIRIDELPSPSRDALLLALGFEGLYAEKQERVFAAFTKQLPSPYHEFRCWLEARSAHEEQTHA